MATVDHFGIRASEAHSRDPPAIASDYRHGSGFEDLPVPSLSVNKRQRLAEDRRFAERPKTSSLTRP
jgi:hypothetical protein